ncbi:MAG: phosphoribosyltransferase [Cyanobacteria bacterium J06639_14]
MTTQFRNRTEAGRLLANWLKVYANRTDTLVLGLPRGGVVVAHEVAHTLQLPLDVCPVQKLSVPGQEELAMGAIAAGNVRVLNGDVLNELHISQQTLEKVTTQARQELQRRERIYRGDRPPLEVQNQTIILVNDGLTTGATMRAAIACLKSQQPQRIIVAIPVAPPYVYRALRTEVDQVICLAMPDPFYALRFWYESFAPVKDEEVHEFSCMCRC